MCKKTLYWAYKMMLAETGAQKTASTELAYWQQNVLVSAKESLTMANKSTLPSLLQYLIKSAISLFKPTA